MRRDLVIDLPLRVERGGSRTLSVQLADQIRALISSGRVRPGDHLPSTRQAAARLGVSRGCVTSAYDQLQAEGYLVAAHGSGTSVNRRLDGLHAGTPSTVRTGTVGHGAEVPDRPHLLDLRPGQPDTSSLADSVWRGAWREAVSSPPGPVEDPLGLWELRCQIAEHLRQMRGLIATPDRVVVTAGAREGLATVLGTWAAPDRAVLRIGVESPGYPSLRRVPPALGHRTVDLATDAHGLRTGSLPDGPGDGLDAVLVTPSHQYPYGGSLDAERRVALTAWASGHHSWLIEDDFDSELRHVGSPLPALAAMAPDLTVLLGTFSSLLSPSVACGYLVLPASLVAPVGRRRQALGQPVGALVQTALAHYLASGALRRRTQRMRRIYRRRRQMVVDTVGDLPGARLQPINGGLQAVLVCRGEETGLVECCRRAGVGVTPLSSYWGGAGAEHGLVLGFGAHDDATLAHSLRRVASIIGGRIDPG
ncbi:PLP-dependent aminotransferase family protein [Acidipropionibacterium jensenii]|uniref:MocR-like pyridoxine biosynthesis transcription factor PdxR n=1 Tax=Acidipropionibacterium jensenii TaxID=1749 RepID=UPI001F258E26|nr:PLP-dependent aminotransferase family protein [Acidipropionibacterium jensenii]